jgi:ParB family transcriptional regulator, chromosome partitioning protein
MDYTEEIPMNIAIDHVIIPTPQRGLHDLTELMASIREVGLLHPITVTADYQLIAGYHRLEACKRLGWPEIPATILDVDRLRAELARLDENLIRHDLTVLERAEQLHRRKEIYITLHPETTQRSGPGRGHREKQGNHFPAFAVDTAAKTGTTPRTIRQEVQIASQLSAAVRDAIRHLPIADHKTELLQLARLSPAAQEAIASQLISQAARTVREA